MWLWWINTNIKDVLSIIRKGIIICVGKKLVHIAKLDPIEPKTSEKLNIIFANSC